MISTSTRQPLWLLNFTQRVYNFFFFFFPHYLPAHDTFQPIHSSFLSFSLFPLFHGDGRGCTHMP